MIDTPRLRLRPLAEGHLPHLVRWEADPVLRDLNDEDASPAPAAEVEETVRAWLRPGREDILPFAIHTREEDACIGWCMIAKIDRAEGECRVGLTIGDRSLWGRGLGREVLEALVAHALGPLGLSRVLGEAHSFNERSVRLLKRCGFTLLRVERGSIRRADGVWDELVYARTK